MSTYPIIYNNKSLWTSSQLIGLIRLLLIEQADKSQFDKTLLPLLLDDINKSSLDRIDSNKPYIEGNVQWVTVQANRSKHTLSMQELYEFCQKVLNHANQQPSQEI